MARRENLRLLWRVWRPGTGWLLLGIGGVGLGGLVSGGEDFLARTIFTLALLAIGGFLLLKTAKEKM